VHNHGPFRPILAQDARSFKRQFAGNGIGVLARRTSSPLRSDLGFRYTRGSTSSPNRASFGRRERAVIALALGFDPEPVPVVNSIQLA
jgi:hypothetical protein